MASSDSLRFLVVAIASLAAALTALGVGMIEALTPYQRLLVAVAALLALMSLWLFALSVLKLDRVVVMRAERRRRRKDSLRSLERQRLREQYGPEIRLWDPFQEAAEDLQAVWAKAYLEERPFTEEDRRQLRERLEDVISKAQRLLGPDRDTALRLLEPYREFATGSQVHGDLWWAYDRLEDWLSSRHRAYMDIRRRAGL